MIYTDDEVAGLSFDDQSNWLKCRPVTAARHFEYRLNALFQGILKSAAKPLGESADYAIRIKFQARGSPHAHCVIWVKDAPKHIKSPDSAVCYFIDKYVSCALPADDCKLRELVSLLQQHKHSSYCKRNKTCRFNFPKPPSPKTLITKFDENTDIEHSKTVLEKVQKLLKDASTDLSLPDLLDKDLTETEYVEALESSCTGSVVVLKREISECCINNYNPAVLLAWQANTPEHLWNSIAPSTEEHRLHSIAEGTEQLTEVFQQDLQDNQNILSQSSLHVRFESSTNRSEIPPEQYRQYMRELNDKQQSIVMFHHDWCKKTVLALKQNKSVEPYHEFPSGPGGVGKSHVIKLIHSDTLKLLKLSGTFEPEDVIVLLTAPTGVAAFNTDGMTLHSALLLGRSKYSGFQPLSHDRLNTLRTKLSWLMLLIVDEVSMVGANMLLEIHRQLQQIKDDAVFGNVSILAFGDLYQLPPVGQAPLFNTVSDCYAQLCGSGSFWIDLFVMHELTQMMRQRDDQAFSELLCHVRTNS